jgi:hypothetical protein
MGTVTRFSLAHVTSTAIHLHQPNDHTWPPHTDDEYLSFDMHRYRTHGVVVHIPTKEAVTPYRRALATVFYVNNYFDMLHDGGGTLFYDAQKKASRRLAPKNNRMLIFPVSPESFHGFESNKKERMSMVQWFYYKQ